MNVEAKPTPNPSLKRSANGRPPGPVWRYTVHFRQPGLWRPAVVARLARTFGGLGEREHRGDLLPIGDIKMNASDLIDDLIAKLTDWRGVTFTNIRKIVRDADPEIVEEWKWMGTPVWSHDGIVCVANAFKDKVKLTFYEGASLPRDS